MVFCAYGEEYWKHLVKLMMSMMWQKPGTKSVFGYYHKETICTGLLPVVKDRIEQVITNVVLLYCIWCRTML